jgi:hypothetical protein
MRIGGQTTPQALASFGSSRDTGSKVAPAVAALGASKEEVASADKAKADRAAKVADLRLSVSTLTPRLDPTHARTALPYALISKDVYSNEKGLAAPAANVRRIADWETVMRANGVSASEISRYKQAGFDAGIYKNDKTGEIIVAYRGTESWGNSIGTKIESAQDWRANITARLGGVEPQYKAASDLARMVRDQWSKSTPDKTITLTGHSLGGGLASYAGQQQRIKNVYTFNAARNPLSASGQHAGQVNVAVPGDVVGDPGTSSDVGRGSLPGQTYNINTTSDQAGLSGTHEMDGIIGGMRAVIRSNP